MKGLGEIFVRALTKEVDPEAIARDLVPMMDAVRKHGVPVQFPTAWSQFPGGLFYGNPVWADEVAARYPDVPVILTKMGRGLTTYYETCIAVAMRNANVHFDVVGTSPEHLRHALSSAHDAGWLHRLVGGDQHEALRPILGGCGRHELGTQDVGAHRLGWVGLHQRHVLVGRGVEDHLRVMGLEHRCDHLLVGHVGDHRHDLDTGVPQGERGEVEQAGLVVVERH